MTETVPSPDAGQHLTNIRHALFQILPGHDLSGNTLRVRDGGEHPFTINLVDPDFLANLKNGQIVADTDTVFFGEFLERQDLVNNTISKFIALIQAGVLRERP